VLAIAAADLNAEDRLDTVVVDHHREGLTLRGRARGVGGIFGGGRQAE